MEEKIKYKLFFSDLDHTLLVDHHIPAFNLEAIKQIKEKGVKFVICTGRPLKLVKNLLKELETEDSENEYTVCNSGCTIYENKNEKLIYFKGIDYETAQLVLEFGKKFTNVSISFGTFDGTYVFNQKIEEKEDIEKKERRGKWPGFKRTEIKSIDEIKNTQIIRIVITSRDPNNLLNIGNEMKKDKSLEGKISFFMSGTRMIEINSFGVCKGEALKWLSNYLKIDMKETIAIGDDFNDESMLKEAGLGCCVKSAHDEIKKVAKYICEKDYFEGSVKEIIDKFILN